MSRKKYVVYTDVDPDSFRMRSPRRNRDGNSMSAISIRKTHIQMGRPDSLKETDMSCLFRGIIDAGRAKAANIQILDDHLLTWVCDKEAEMAATVHENSEKWFGKHMDLQTTRRMIASVVDNDVVAVKCAGYIDVYKLDGEGGCDRLSGLDNVEPNSYCTPIVRFDGLYIGEQHFSCSFTMVAVLVGEVCPEEDALSQFVREQDDPDISDPLMFASEGSGHSFDTTVHREHMATFDI